MDDTIHSMGDDESDLFFRDAINGFGNLLFAFAVKRTGRFVEDKDLRISVDCTSDGDTLSLTS